MNTELIISKLENFIEDKNYLLLVHNWLNQLLKYNPRECIVEIFDDNVIITWNKGDYYFSNDIYLNGYVSWFFRNRINDDAVEGLEFIFDEFHSFEFQRLIKIATE